LESVKSPFLEVLSNASAYKLVKVDSSALVSGHAAATAVAAAAASIECATIAAASARECAKISALSLDEEKARDSIDNKETTEREEMTHVIDVAKNDTFTPMSPGTDGAPPTSAVLPEEEDVEDAQMEDEVDDGAICVVGGGGGGVWGGGYVRSYAHMFVRDCVSLPRSLSFSLCVRVLCVCAGCVCCAFM
jgi:hypothetical protein